MDSSNQYILVSSHIHLLYLQAIAAMSTITVKFSDLIRQFDGTGDFMEWLDKLELVAKMQNISDLGSLLPLFLTGGAFAVYKGIDDADQKDYDKVKNALQLAFSSDSIVAYEDLQRRKLQVGESVDVYVADITRLAKLVDSKLSPTYIKCAFVAGLPIEMKKQLKAACKLNTMLLADVVDRARTLSKSEDSLCFAASKISERRKCFQCGQEGHVSRFSPVSARKNLAQQPKCFNCGEDGHMSKECPKRSGQRRCYVCGDASHLAPSCPKKYQPSKNE